MPVTNKVILIGNLGDDPRVFTSKSGNEFVTFSLATNRHRKDDKGNKITTTAWHDCVVYGPRAQVVKNYCKKGSHLAVEAELDYTSYEKNGVKVRKAMIVVEDFQFLGGDRQNRQQTYNPPVSANNTSEQEKVAEQPQAQNQAAAPTAFTGVDPDLANALGDNDFAASAGSIESTDDFDFPF